MGMIPSYLTRLSRFKKVLVKCCLRVREAYQKHSLAVASQVQTYFYFLLAGSNSMCVGVGVVGLSNIKSQYNLSHFCEKYKTPRRLTH